MSAEPLLPRYALARYVLADLVRNPRRTLSTMVGVVLGVGLFCGVLFFVDGLSASMTQRAVAPLPIDMQRIVTQPAGAVLMLTQTFEDGTSGAGGERRQVVMELQNRGRTTAHDVTVRSVPASGLEFVAGSARIDGQIVPAVSGNPFAQGPARAGYNLGALEPGGTRRLTYLVDAASATTVDDTSVATSHSSRESLTPTPANQASSVGLDELASRIAAVPGVARASQLSIADLGVDAVSAQGRTAPGAAKVFGFDDGYADPDETIVIVDGTLTADGAVLSAEAAARLGVARGDVVTVRLPDGSSIERPITGTADLSRSRSLFSSRRGGDLETFIYTPYAVILSPADFAASVLPAYERAAADGSGRLKNPVLREIDVTVERELLDADPASALVQTRRIAADVTAVADHQDFVLDNITNTLSVAAADAAVAKRLFVFLGVPGGLLAAMLAAYAGNVLAEAQRREQATLRIRGAGRSHLVRMLTARTALLTATGSLLGMSVGYLMAAAILGRDALERASAASLAASALIGSSSGFAATGLALYLTGRRSIDREINEDRAQLTTRRPLWLRTRLDLVGLVVVIGGTWWAVRANAFEGAPGSVYFGRSVELNLALLVLPVTVWITGSLVAARVIGSTLHRTRPASSARLGRAAPALFRRSIGRRPWAISNGAVVAALVVGLATSLAVFTASYDAAKVDDARYATGADIKITPSPTAGRTYSAGDASLFLTPSVTRSAPVVYGLSNVILRSARTSDPANLAALDPDGYAEVAPVDAAVARDIRALRAEPDAVLVSRDMAEFLKARPGDTLHLLLARATPDQVEVDLTIAGLYERLPGFPDGADAVMSLDRHTAAVPGKVPDFFLATAGGETRADLQRAVEELRSGPGASGHLQIDTRATTLDRDQSSLAALNIAGLVALDSSFALAMACVTIAIFVFGLLLQRRREYVTLRAQGLPPRAVGGLITAEAATVAAAGTLAGLAVGAAMGYYFVAVLRPLFVLDPNYALPLAVLALPVGLVLIATIAFAAFGFRLVAALQPTELLRDD